MGTVVTLNSQAGATPPGPLPPSVFVGVGSPVLSNGWDIFSRPDHLFDLLPKPIAERKARLCCVALCERLLEVSPTPANAKTVARVRDDIALALKIAEHDSPRTFETERQTRHSAAVAETKLARDWVYGPYGHYFDETKATHILSFCAECALAADPQKALRAALSANLTLTPSAPVCAKNITPYGLGSDEGNVVVRSQFANPFLPLPDPATYLTDQVVEAVGLMEDSGDYTKFPELGLLLVTAGCADPEVIHHCAVRHPHFRGDWVIDWLKASPDFVPAPISVFVAGAATEST